MFRSTSFMHFHFVPALFAAYSRNDVDKDTAVCLDCEAYFRQYGKVIDLT